MSHAFVPVAERIVDAILAADPLTATAAGDHRFDDKLPDLSADGVAARVAMLRDASDGLAQIDIEALPAAEQVDHALLQAHVERGLFDLTELREYQWNPLLHNPGDLIDALISRPTGTPEQRLHSLAGRLAAIPDAMASARQVLQDCPRIHLETGAGQFTGTAALIRDELPSLLAQVPSMSGEVRPVADQAIAALDGFAVWLREQATGGEHRDARLGRPMWEARLWHTLDTEMSAEQILAATEDNLTGTSAALRELAARFVGGPADDDAVRRAFAAVAEQRPDNDTIVGWASASLAETTEFVRVHDLVTILNDPCVVQVMPEYARGVSIAYCESPGPLETADVVTLYCISPAPSTWSPERIDSFYREYNNDMVRDLTVHEAMPGHYLQLAHSRRYHGSTRTRALGLSGPFVEGWAVYAEELMADAGYGGVPVRLQQLKMQLRMSINAMLDQLVHCTDLTKADAMELMCARGFQEEGEAAGKWRRALLTSTQLSTYFVGYLEVSAIARARPAGTPVRDWHDAMLSHGSPSPRHLRRLLAV